MSDNESCSLIVGWQLLFTDYLGEEALVVHLNGALRLIR